VESIVIPKLKEAMLMVEKNIFRPLPYFEKEVLDSKDTGVVKAPLKEPSWPYIRGIYEFLKQLVSNPSVDSAHLKPLITNEFIRQFIYLTDSNQNGE